ncbi:TIGR04066 family peptide maturation system protein [Kineothrix sp. MB12-C1]|uniref:TIGR04066 family peptide maturation system protein n=1 Tax=Kineothrix sp. MB12-C1 TaxID=3070215 RepID=UPI0027D2A610|nr:TIGR04066 family peptide maturation system protein [Kineothrix sp. MB12-C1]WMC93048.1 TIGR04066 family peptide maturation system protein [Kineothrix sp. MB12-C1]
MNKKLMIYPFNKRVNSIAKYAQLLENYILIAAVSPKSYGYEGKDISCIDGSSFVGITITSAFQESLEKCDSVLFSASTFLIDLSYYEERIQEAFNYNKEVLITKELAENFILNKKNIPSNVKVLGDNPPGKKISYTEIKHIQEIPVPVMTIFQIGEFCNGFDTQLLITKRFEEEGYRVSKISSCPLGSIFGMHMLPDYIYQSNMTYEDKIVSFNHFLISIIDEEQPDILLLQIEEAILPYNDKVTNHFGVIPEIVAHAAQADIGILSLYYNDFYDKEYLDHLRAFCRYTLNIEINYINMANTTMSIQEFDIMKPIHYVLVDWNIVIHSISSDYKNYDCLFFNTYDLSSVDTVYYDIINHLSQNKETVRIW